MTTTNSRNIAKSVAGAAAVFTLIGFGMGLQATLDSRSSTTASTSAETSNSLPTTSLTEPDPKTAVTAEASTTTETNSTTTRPTTTTEAKALTLTELTRTEGEGFKYRETGGIGLVEYDNILWCHSDGDSSGAEFRLDRKYKTFTATVGYPDDHPSDGWTALEIYDETNQILFEGPPLQLGETQDVAIDISNVIRLRLFCQRQLGLVNDLLIPQN